MGRQVHSWTPG